jgi:hypothetical protein
MMPVEILKGLKRFISILEEICKPPYLLYVFDFWLDGAIAMTNCQWYQMTKLRSCKVATNFLLLHLVFDVLEEFGSNG